MSKWSAAERIFCEFQRHRKGVAFVSSLPAVHSLFPPTIPRWSLGVHRRTPLITHQVFIVFISLWVYAHAQWNCNVFIDSFMFFFSHFCFFFPSTKLQSLWAFFDGFVDHETGFGLVATFQTPFNFSCFVLFEF